MELRVLPMIFNPSLFSDDPRKCCLETILRHHRLILEAIQQTAQPASGLRGAAGRDRERGALG